MCSKLFFCKQLSLVINKQDLRPKNYENRHKNIIGLSVLLELKVKTVQFWLLELVELSDIFFIKEYEKRRLTYFDNSNF